jgi:PAS domain S-box-containing protein
MNSFVPPFHDLTHLSEREKGMMQVLDHISEGFWIWYVTEDYEYMSPRFWEILGYLPSEKKSHPSEWQALIHREDLPLLLDNFNKHVQSHGKTPFSMEVRYTHKRGHRIWVRCEGRVTEWDESKHPKKVVGIHRDVTKEKLQQVMNSEISDLRARYIEYATDLKKFFSHLLTKILKLTESEYGFIGEIVNGEEGRYLKTYWLSDISWNEETRKFFKENAPKGLIFKNLKTLFGYVIRTEKPMITNDPAHHPESGGLPKGHPPLHSFMGIPIFFSGKFIAMAGVANRKDGFSEEFYEYLKPYFEVVGEMIHAKMIQEELDKQVSLTMHHARLASIGQLAAGVGHEINNPLAIISGQLYLLEKHLSDQHHLDSETDERISKINKSITRISNIVKGLKAYSRTDDGVMSTFDLYDLVKETVDMMVDLFLKEQVVIKFEGKRIFSMVNGHRGRIQQVLVNLITNARDASVGKEKRWITVEMSLASEMVQVSVTDNGEGISEDVKERMFDPFFTTKEVTKGTGIGLFLVKNIMKEHKGRIDVKSRLHEGSTFTISLPLSETHASVPEKTSIEGPGDKFDKRVLIVDDEDDIRDFLHYILSSLVVHVVSVRSGVEALEYLRGHQVDLILSDIKMPGMDGFELLENVKNKKGNGAEFVFISGGVDLTPPQKELIQKYTKGVIQKPFSPNDLKEKFRMIFNTSLK